MEVERRLWGAIGSGGLSFVASNADYSGTGELNLFSVNNVTFVRGVQNSSTGDVNVVAGWNDEAGFAPTIGPDSGASTPAGHGALDLGFSPPVSFTYDFTRILNAGVANAARYGVNNGVVTVGAAANAASVGSSAGNSNVLGYGVLVTAGDSSDERAQIGYYGASTGNIEVHAKAGGVALTAGSGNWTFAKIGHGLNRATSASSGDILVSTSGMVSLIAGSSTDSFVQIGHGGVTNSANQGLAGDSTEVSAGTGVILRASTGDNAYALIGNGGLASNATMRSDITVTTTGGNIVLDGGLGTGDPGPDDEFAQIGNTGVQSTTANTRGSITVQALAGNVSLNAGGRRCRYYPRLCPDWQWRLGCQWNL